MKRVGRREASVGIIKYDATEEGGRDGKGGSVGTGFEGEIVIWWKWGVFSPFSGKQR